jgi:hypothetical protein
MSKYTMGFSGFLGAFSVAPWPRCPGVWPCAGAVVCCCDCAGRAISVDSPAPAPLLLLGPQPMLAGVVGDYARVPGIEMLGCLRGLFGLFRVFLPRRVWIYRKASGDDDATTSSSHDVGQNSGAGTPTTDISILTISSHPTTCHLYNLWYAHWNAFSHRDMFIAV